MKCYNDNECVRSLVVVRREWGDGVISVRVEVQRIRDAECNSGAELQMGHLALKVECEQLCIDASRVTLQGQSHGCCRWYQRFKRKANGNRNVGALSARLPMLESCIFSR